MTECWTRCCQCELQTSAGGERQDRVCIGVSVGALNACYFAGTPTAEGVMGLQRVWSGLRRRDVFPIGLASALRMLWHPNHLVNPARLRRLVATHIPYA